MVTIEDAFEVLQVAVENALMAAQEDVSEAIQSRNFDSAQLALDHSRELVNLHQQVEKMQAEFDRLINKPVETDQSRQRLRSGLKTPVEAYYQPILETIIELGGSANLSNVLDLVYRKMRHQLNEHDHALLSSDGSPRWRKTANWARYNLIQQGLLRDDSPRGVWEISEKGRAWIEQN